MTLNVYPCIFPLALCCGYLLYYYDTSHFLFFLLFCTCWYNCMYYKCLAQIKKHCLEMFETLLKRNKLNVDLKLLLIQIIMLLFLSVHAIKMLYIYQFMLNVHVIKRHYEFSALCLYSGTEVNECRTRERSQTSQKAIQIIYCQSAATLFKYTLTSLNIHIHTSARKTLNQLKSAPFQIGIAVRL